VLTCLRTNSCICLFLWTIISVTTEETPLSLISKWLPSPCNSHTYGKPGQTRLGRLVYFFGIQTLLGPLSLLVDEETEEEGDENPGAETEEVSNGPFAPRKKKKRKGYGKGDK
jgi:hypothetical protein